MQIFDVGRNISNHIVLSDDMVSRQHAQLIALDTGQVIIKDLGSSNGTFVNGNRISECYLKPGDIVKCGSTFLQWSQYVSIKATAPDLPKTGKSEAVFDFNRSGMFESIRHYTVFETFKYITTRVFNVGDLFRYEWQSKTSILFFFLFPLLAAVLFGSLILGLMPGVGFAGENGSFTKHEFQLLTCTVLCFVISPILTLSLLSFNRNTSFAKNLLAASLYSFLEFSIITVLTLVAFVLSTVAVNIHTVITGTISTDSLFVKVFTILTIILAISIVLSIFFTLVITLYNYFRSIDVSKGVSIHLTILSLAFNVLAQICFVYLIISLTN